MEIDINQIIGISVKDLNKLFLSGARIAKKVHKPFNIEDYTYLKESTEFFEIFALPYFLTYSIYKDVEYRIHNPIPGSIWYWKEDIDKNKHKNFLPTQARLLYDTLGSYMALLKLGNHMQALILFRSYIEYSSQFYASLLDYEFFLKYIGSNVLEEEYKQHWFTSLKPAKVLAQIKSIHTEINQLLREKRIEYKGTAVFRRMLSRLIQTYEGSFTEIFQRWRMVPIAP